MHVSFVWLIVLGLLTGLLFILVHKRKLAQASRTCSEPSGETRSLAQVVVLYMELKICLLPEVPCTGCAAKQLLFIAMLHCQMDLNNNG